MILMNVITDKILRIIKWDRAKEICQSLIEKYEKKIYKVQSLFEEIYLMQIKRILKR